MEFLVNIKSPKLKKYFELILPRMITELGLDKSQKVVVVTVEGDCPDLGLTVAMPAVGGFVIIIKAGQSIVELGRSLAHELVHVRQMAKGTLKAASRGAHTWAGKRYPASTPYYSRPWEVDAFSRQEIIFRRAVCEQ